MLKKTLENESGFNQTLAFRNTKTDLGKFRRQSMELDSADQWP